MAYGNSYPCSPSPCSSVLLSERLGNTFPHKYGDTPTNISTTILFPHVRNQCFLVKVWVVGVILFEANVVVQEQRPFLSVG